MKKHICKFFAGFLLAALAIYGCSKESASPDSSGDGGVGGSMARFATVGNYLYTVDHSSLNVFDLTDPAKPQLVNTANVGMDIETIYPRDAQTLFIGSESAFFIYSLEDPRNPRRLTPVRHVRSYDPVVANDKYAFVTLRTGLNRGGVDELQVYDITDLANAQLLKTYPMVNPYGLGLKDSTLYVCDDSLKVYNAADPMNLQKKKFYPVKGYDVIPLPQNILVIGSDGLYQYSDGADSLTLLSKIPVSAN